MKLALFLVCFVLALVTGCAGSLNFRMQPYPDPGMPARLRPLSTDQAHEAEIAWAEWRACAPKAFEGRPKVLRIFLDPNLPTTGAMNGSDMYIHPDVGTSFPYAVRHEAGHLLMGETHSEDPASIMWHATRAGPVHVTALDCERLCFFIHCR